MLICCPATDVGSFAPTQQGGTTTCSLSGQSPGWEAAIDLGTSALIDEAYESCLSKGGRLRLLPVPPVLLARDGALKVYVEA